MAKDTKERILMSALEMFSQKGYEGTNIRELSASLGLVKSGIYKHYESNWRQRSPLTSKWNIDYRRVCFGTAASFATSANEES